MKDVTLRSKLIAMNFLQFAVWGAYLICMGRYLGSLGLGDKIGIFYSIQGIVSKSMEKIKNIAILGSRNREKALSPNASERLFFSP